MNINNMVMNMDMNNPMSTPPLNFIQYNYRESLVNQNPIGNGNATNNNNNILQIQ